MPVLDEAALGPDDPPSRPVDPADPAGLDLEEDVVELQDDPAVAAAVDALPGARRQPGGEPPARPEAELERLVDQVRAPVVEDRPGGRGAAAPSSRGGGAADGALEQQRPADPAPVEDVLDGGVVPVPPPIVEDRQHPARSVARGDHPVGIPRSMSAMTLSTTQCRDGVERPHGQLGVRVVGRGDDDQLDRRVGEGLVELGIAADAVAPEGHRLLADPRVAGDDPVQPQPRLAPDQADSGTPGPPGRGRRRRCESCDGSSRARSRRDAEPSEATS